ncbi:hypothetical protein BC629DRAFT_1441124 [Irpex lacteus]|nr:hypothetical protein BC629DRAFT_1441124 [Irpex lacteus]
MTSTANLSLEPAVAITHDDPELAKVESVYSASGRLSIALTPSLGSGNVRMTGVWYQLKRVRADDLEASRGSNPVSLPVSKVTRASYRAANYFIPSMVVSLAEGYLGWRLRYPYWAERCSKLVDSTMWPKAGFLPVVGSSNVWQHLTSKPHTPSTAFKTIEIEDVYQMGWPRLIQERDIRFQWRGAALVLRPRCIQACVHMPELPGRWYLVEW